MALKRRRRFARHLRTADTPKRPKSAKPVRSGGRLRHPFRGGHFYPKPKTPRPARKSEPRTPRMRPKRSVVDRITPSSEPRRPRTIVRLGVLGVTVAALFSLVLVRLWYLQVLDTTAYAQKVTANQVRAVQVSPPRGLIVDRSGGELVRNQVTEDITLSRLSAQQHPGVVGQLAALLGISSAAIEADLNNPRFSLYKPVPIMENATMAAVSAIKENPQLYPGVAAQVDSQLAYPMGNDRGPDARLHPSDQRAPSWPPTRAPATSRGTSTAKTGSKTSTSRICAAPRASTRSR